MGLHVEEEALSKLNFIKNGKYEIDEGILAGYTEENLFTYIGKQSQLPLTKQCKSLKTTLYHSITSSCSCNRYMCRFCFHEKCPEIRAKGC